MPGNVTGVRSGSQAWSVVRLAGQVQLKPSTKARYELAVTRHILPAWENVRLSDVAYADV